MLSGAVRGRYERSFPARRISAKLPFMDKPPAGPELDRVERYLRQLIKLTEQGKFDELAGQYRIKPARRKDAPEFLRRNQNGHLKMLNWVLSNRPKWVWMGSIGKVMALMGNRLLEYPDDGLWFDVKGQGPITEPFGDNLVATRKVERLKPEIRSGAQEVGISPFVFKEVQRLKGRFTVKSPGDPIRAFRGIDWGNDVDFSTPDSDEENFVAGMTFAPVPPYPAEYLPECYSRHPGFTWIGNDCYYYFSIKPDEIDPLDPMVFSIDHEKEKEDPLAETFLSIWLSRLRRSKGT